MKGRERKRDHEGEEDRGRGKRTPVKKKIERGIRSQRKERQQTERS